MTELFNKILDVARQMGEAKNLFILKREWILEEETEKEYIFKRRS